MEFLSLISNHLIGFGVSYVGSFVTGKVAKVIPGPNDMIPAYNNTIWGVGATAVTGDPSIGIAGFAGATAANFSHKGFQWLKKKLLKGA